VARGRVGGIGRASVVWGLELTSLTLSQHISWQNREGFCPLNPGSSSRSRALRPGQRFLHTKQFGILIADLSKSARIQRPNAGGEVSSTTSRCSSRCVSRLVVWTSRKRLRNGATRADA